MRRIIIMLFLMMTISVGFAIAKDNIYGGYLLMDSESPVSLDLEGANLIDVLKMFSQQTGLNFISTEAVKDRQLTLYMNEVPLEKAMDTIFSANNLAYDYFPESNVFIVKEMGKPTIELLTKVYPLKYACVSDSRIAKGFSTDVSSSDDSGGGIDEADGVGTNISSIVEKIISENGSVSEEPRINALIVTDVPSQFPAIDKVIAELDKPVLKVMIEVEVLDISKGDLKEFGMMVNYKGHSQSKKHFSFMDTETTPLNNFFGTIAQGLNGGSVGTLALNEFNMMMTFLEQKSSTRLLAQPKLLVLSHQEAIIHVGNEIWSKDTEHFEGGDSSTAIGDKKTQTGVQLQIIPQVNSELSEDITLVVSIEISDAFAEITGDDFYTKPTRSVNTITRVGEGETLLLGGLIRKDTDVGKEKIPFLGDIPFLGAFFRSKSNDKDERELIVFITPRIVEGQSYTAKKSQSFHLGKIDPSRRQSVRFALDRFCR